MPKRVPLDCPFCNFTDHDHYFLLQHVETVHPEGGQPSPFAVRVEVTRERGIPVEETTGVQDSSPEYIECQCGEFCLLTEFQSHLEMHYAERIGFDETPRASADLAASEAIIRHGKDSSPRMEFSSTTPLQFVASGPSQPIPIRSVVERSHRSTGRKSGNAVRDFIDVLRHSTSPPSKTLAQAARNRAPRRLGVRDSIYYFPRQFAEVSDRELSLAPMPMKNKCQIGCAMSSSLARKSRPPIRLLRMVDYCEQTVLPTKFRASFPSLPNSVSRILPSRGPIFATLT